MKTLVSAMMMLSAVVNVHMELVAVIVVFRHGARAPVGNYTQGAFKKRFPYGNGQLTEEGMQASIELGKYLGERYVIGKNFLRVPLLPREIYFRSKANDPCLMTASAVGSAMFASAVKPAKSAVAVYTQEKLNEDYMLAHPLNCPYELSRLKKKCDKEADQNLGWPKFEAFVFECLSLHKQSEFFKNPKDFERAEALIVEDKSGLHKDNEEFKKMRKELYDMYQKVYAYNIGVGEPKMLKLKQGRLLYAIMEILKRAHNMHETDGNVKDNKFNAFSAQDWLMQALLNALGAAKNVLGETIPDFTSMIMFELMKGTGGDWQVKVFYKRDADSKEKDITTDIRNCYESPCGFENFVNCCTEFESSEPEKLCRAEYTVK